MQLTRFEALGLLPDAARLRIHRPARAGHIQCALDMEDVVSWMPDAGLILCLWKQRPELGPMVRIIREDGPWYVCVDKAKLKRMADQDNCRLMVERKPLDLYGQ